jgi:hypothetical protein
LGIATIIAAIVDEGCADKSASREGLKMWVLIVANLTVPSSFTVPGYSSAEKCQAARLEIFKDLGAAMGQQGVPRFAIFTSCKQVD